MSEKRFKLIKPLGTRLGLKDIFIKDTQKDYYYTTKETVVDLLNGLSEENEQLKKQLNKYDKLKISIFNKDKGDWKWNDNNDIILNIRNGKSFYLRNSGAVENLVGLLNEQQATINKLQDTVYDELDKALKVLEEIYEDYPKNNVHRLYNNLKGLKEMME